MPATLYSADLESIYLRYYVLYIDDSVLYRMKEQKNPFLSLLDITLKRI